LHNLNTAPSVGTTPVHSGAMHDPTAATDQPLTTGAPAERSEGSADPNVTRGAAFIRPLVISAPFGNYVQPPGTTPTLGTFTRLRRTGRLWRILRTVRYYRRLDAWVNKIGLRNPGIDWFADACRAGRIDPADKLVSIHGFTNDDWSYLLEKTAAVDPLAIELNISCPNVGELAWPEDLFQHAVATQTPVVVKLPPINYERALADALHAGVRLFHCCNTLPVAGGGMSGKPLRPLVLNAIERVRTEEAARRSRGELHGPITIIAGGGVSSTDDVDRYLDARADRVAIGSSLMHPRFVRYLRDKHAAHPRLTPLLEHAARRNKQAAAAARPPI